VDELVKFTIQALECGNGRAHAMQKTLEQKAAYCDGTSARRFVEAVAGILEPVSLLAPSRTDAATEQSSVSPMPHATPAE
jgi:hypothetical protein